MRRLAVLALASATLVPGTAFAVKDEVCARCHRAIYDSYELTPMARASGVVTPEQVPTGSRSEFTAAGATFHVGPAAEVQITEDSRTAAHRLRYFIGAGVTGRSYLYEVGNYLFQSPVAWYSSIRQWNVSPGYEKSSGVNLMRPVETSCIDCHATGVHLVAGTLNRYQQPPFERGGISCERCHGSAEEHLALVTNKTAIVNPAKLDPARRESVCAQCHLTGVVRIAKAGAHPYSPGSVLSDSTAAFIWMEGERPLPANSHFEQLARSACWRMSQGRMWCGTCHDPHRAVAPAERAQYYRARCETCHSRSARICAAPIATRRRIADNCIACHMVSRPAATVQHAAQTDHTIPRRPATIPETTVIPDDAQLTLFPGSTATDRETGLAYAEEALAHNNRDFGIRAIELLSPVYSAHPSDSQVADQLAQLLDKAERQNQACEVFQHASGNSDAPVAALVNAGVCLASAGRTQDAIAFWQKALAKNPGEESARLNLAVALYRSGNSAQARATLEYALRLDPFFSRARDLLAEMR